MALLDLVRIDAIGARIRHHQDEVRPRQALGTRGAHGTVGDRALLRVGDFTYDRRHLAGPIKFSLAWTASTNVYCVYAFTVPIRVPPVDPQNFEFGDSFVFFHDTVAFLDPELRREVRELHKLNQGALAFCGRLLEQAVDVRPRTFGTGARRAEVAEVGSAIFFLDAYMRNDDRQSKSTPS